MIFFSLRSQNDALRAEIEAQNAAHKLNISSIEAQSHTAWLNARQAERRLEETRTEAAALRRRLTQIAETPTSSGRDVLSEFMKINEVCHMILTLQFSQQKTRWTHQRHNEVNSITRACRVTK